MNAVLYAFVIGLHILICFILIVVVLLQTGKGADAGALMGGSSQTVFGSRGPTTFFHYLTGGAAGLFLVTSLFLSCTPGPGKKTGSELDDLTPTPVTTPGDDGHGHAPGETHDGDLVAPPGLTPTPGAAATAASTSTPAAPAATATPAAPAATPAATATSN